MSMEAIQRILAAEAEAHQIRAEAETAAERILEAARQAGEERIRAAERKADTELSALARKVDAVAALEGRAQREHAAEQEAALCAQAAHRLDEAAQVILERLVGG